MRKWIGFFHWLTICLIVAAFLFLYYLEDTLPISQTDHTLIAVGLLIALLVATFTWINHNETDFLVSPQYLEKLAEKSEHKEDLEKK